MTAGNWFDPDKELPADVSREQLEKNLSEHRAWLVEGVELYTHGPFNRAQLIARARFAIGQIGRLQLEGSKRGAFTRTENNEAQLAVAYLAAALATLEHAVIDDPMILREQIKFHARRALEQAKTVFVKDVPA